MALPRSLFDGDLKEAERDIPQIVEIDGKEYPVVLEDDGREDELGLAGHDESRTITFFIRISLFGENALPDNQDLVLFRKRNYRIKNIRASEEGGALVITGESENS